MRISDWSSDVCSSDLGAAEPKEETVEQEAHRLKCELARQLSQIENLKRQTAVCRTLIGSLEIDVTAKAQALSSKERLLALERERCEELERRVFEQSRSEERHGGKECGSTCRSRCWPDQ